LECQDAYRYAFEPSSGALVLAVADGAGSRPRSAEGATLAVGMGVARLVEVFRERGLPKSGAAWHALLRGEYEGIVSSFRGAIARLGPDPKEFAATLTLAVLAPPWVGIVRLGDGFVVARARDDSGADQLHLVSFPPPAGEYVNETFFLTSTEALREVEIDCVYDEGLTALLVASDGLIPPGVQRSDGSWLPNRSFLDPVLAALTGPRTDPAEVPRLLLDDRISSLSGDDKTLLVALRST
jgi:hypothetical protein